ncbi:kinase-like protein [Rhizoclosmatium globosum]|uniref:Kinase-like protein n=1 Tax=Rhizoclosmatium globosum TaxID=329046 RepID=A0A1Y2CWW8_9FUNG|nr:kinase-like protein [Rhizoclosmatium globosum]|eukprot:ORY51519.1 kinase-like protein [Rhizoclosmatium globosum]
MDETKSPKHVPMPRAGPGPSPALYPKRYSTAMATGTSSPLQSPRQTYLSSPQAIGQSPRQRPLSTSFKDQLGSTRSPQLRAAGLGGSEVDRSPSLRTVPLSQPISSTEDQDHVEMDVVYLVHDTPKTPFMSVDITPVNPNNADKSWYRTPQGLAPKPVIDEIAHDYDDIEDEDHLFADADMDDLVLDVKPSPSIKVATTPSVPLPIQSPETKGDIENERFTFATLAHETEEILSTTKEQEGDLAAAEGSAAIDATKIVEEAAPSVPEPIAPVQEHINENKRNAFPLKFNWIKNLKDKMNIRSNSVPDLRFSLRPSRISTDSKAYSQGTVLASTKATGSPLGFLALVSDHPVSSRQKKIEYQQLKILGQGVQGTVSLRLHTPTGGIVALKSMSVNSVVVADARKSFRQEVEILQKTRKHPNIIRLLDFWEGKEKVYQVFEICSGGDLEGGLSAGPMAEDEGVRLVAPLMDAVRYMHELGILHRDIRPANVLFRRPLSGHESLQELMSIPVLADFGIAAYERFSGRMGSEFPIRPAYIAPDVVDGGRYRKSADVFGVGVCMVRILLGRAIELDDHNPRILARDPAFVHLSSEGQTFMRGVLESDPTKRFTAADAVNGEWFHSWGVEIVGPVADQ